MVDARLSKTSVLLYQQKNDLELEKIQMQTNDSSNRKLSKNSMNSCSFISTIDTPSNKSLNEDQQYVYVHELFKRRKVQKLKSPKESLFAFKYQLNSDQNFKANLIQVLNLQKGETSQTGQQQNANDDDTRASVYRLLYRKGFIRRPPNPLSQNKEFREFKHYGQKENESNQFDFVFQ